MKVVHVPFGFRPDTLGGTEVYVEALAREQRVQGMDAVVAAPGPQAERYVLDGLPVHRFETSATDLRDLYGAGDPRASRAFGDLLDEQRPDVVHMHAFTSGVSLRMAREARRRDLGLVFTYHTPTASCVRGTLLRWGRQVCDGRLDLHTCASCSLHGLGVNRSAGALLGSLPPTAGRVIGGFAGSGGVWTALRMTELVDLRHAAFRTLMAEVDRVVVLCGWAGDLLRRNGVAAEKIVLSRHGLAQTSAGDIAPARRPWSGSGPLRIAFLGRLDPTKGVDVLINAVRSLPDAPIELHVYGVAQGLAGTAYGQHLATLSAGDQRIAFYPQISQQEVVGRIQEYDLVGVPSRWLETGPLVVLEAFAAGVPVIGSDLGGIGELVDNEVDGLLVPPESVSEWARALRRVLEERGLLDRLRRGVRPPRSMQLVAGEMESVYAALRGAPTAPALVAEVIG